MRVNEGIARIEMRESYMRPIHWLLLIMSGFMSNSILAQSEKPPVKYAIVLHGGAGGNPSRWPADYRQLRREGMSSALDHGVKMLEEGQSAVDVVEAVIRLLEDDPIFNAGRGAVLNEQGQHELDASIMQGKDLSCGAVAGVRKIKHPISLARKVMNQTKHVLLSGSGADEFGESLGMETATAEYFQTERQKQAWQKHNQKQSGVSLHGFPNASGHESSKPAGGESYFGTVGCVVLDKSGDLVAGTSTGGLLGKRWGRVGDSPIIGAGNYAENGTCAVSGTGIGEEFIRRNVAADISARMRYGDSDLKSAAKQTIATLPENAGGIIAVDRDGNIVMEFNTVGMSRAYANSRGERGVLLAREDSAGH